jgi:hypothetical protein
MSVTKTVIGYIADASSDEFVGTIKTPVYAHGVFGNELSIQISFDYFAR